MAFTYLTPILQDITGFSEGYVSYILMFYGIAIAIGNIVGGRISNDNPVRALTVLFALQAIVLVLFSFSAVSPLFTLITLAALGFLQFANVPGLQLYVVQLAKEHRPVRSMSLRRSILLPSIWALRLAPGSEVWWWKASLV